MSDDQQQAAFLAILNNAATMRLVKHVVSVASSKYGSFQRAPISIEFCAGDLCAEVSL